MRCRTSAGSSRCWSPDLKRRDLIKAIEEKSAGFYSPSPGIVYPTLTMLEDMGHIREQKSKDSKKVFEATDEGRAHLEENADEVAKDIIIGGIIE